jgi:hypothetical protein
MKCLVFAAFGVALAGPALAGELISGINDYVTEQRTWKTGEFSGYYMYDSNGTFRARTGSIPDSPVECHGAGFWTAEEIKGDGICIFGEAPHRWTVAFEMAPDNKFRAQTAEKYRRRGTWSVVTGTGKYVGMTGTGSFVTGPVVNGRKTTEWAGEVELPK